jgi:hypothetical protein
VNAAGSWDAGHMSEIDDLGESSVIIRPATATAADLKAA